MTGEAAELLPVVLGSRSAEVVAEADLLARLQTTSGALGIVPFDKIDPLFRAAPYPHLRAHGTVLNLVCRLLLTKKKKNT